MHIIVLPHQGGLVVKELISPQMAWVLVNIGMMTKYSLPT
jgi:hypothetical protein